MALDFLILYEHVVREYESILLLKAELARHSPPARQSASFVRKCAAAPCARAQNGVQ